MNPTFSIILPTFNREHFLAGAIKSVLAQSYQMWELIIVDDGSTDQSRALIEKFIDSDQRIRYVYQVNQERSVARNNGISHAQGSYICFLDSDDVYEENHLTSFFKILQQKDISKTLLYALKTDETNATYPNKFVTLFCSNVHTQQVCIHRDNFEKHNFNAELNIGEDTELWLRMIGEMELECTNLATVRVLDHDDRSVNVTNLKSSEKHLRLKRELAQKYHRQIPRKYRQRMISGALFRIAKYYIIKNERGKAFSYVLKSIFTAPFQRKTVDRGIILLALIRLYPQRALEL